MSTDHPGTLPRVFGIGLNRTGTTSLCDALHTLGYMPTHNRDPTPFFKGDFSTFDHEHNAGADISVAAFYKALDEAFPQSRFILTLRDAESWLQSVLVHFANLPKNSAIAARGDVRERLYGAHWPTPQQFLNAYKRHISEVANHFNGRNDLLVMDATKGEGWDRLCAFLGTPAPGEPYPKSNPTTPDMRERAKRNIEAGKTHGDGVVLPII